MKRILALAGLSVLLMGSGYGPGPVGPPGPGSMGPPAVGPGNGGSAAGGGAACDERSRMPKGQSCGRKTPRKSIIKR